MTDRITTALQAAAPRAPIEGIAAIRRTFKIHVHCGPANPDRREQLTLLLMLLKRTFQNVSCNVAQPAYCQGQTAISVGGVRHSDGPGDASLVLALTQEKVDHAQTIYVDSRGWTAYLSPLEPCGDPPTNASPIGAQFAAALAAQEAFNRAFAGLLPKTRLTDTTTRQSLLASEKGPAIPGPDLSLVTPELDLLLVGVGAVGQAAVYALAALPNLAGRIDLVDHEVIERENADRYLLAGPNFEGKAKVAIGRELLAARHPLLQVHINVEPPARHQGNAEADRWMLALSPGAGGGLASSLPLALTPLSTYHEFRAGDGALPRHVAVAAVDSTQARIDMQFGGHDLVINPWTDTDQAMLYGVGVHALGDKACIACQYRSPRLYAPDRYDFYAGLVGWEREKVKPFLDDPSKMLDPATALELSAQLGLDAGQAQQFVGQRLQKFLDAQCARATIRESDRLGTSPVAHVAVLAGIWTAAYVLLEALRATPGTPCQVFIDAQGPAHGSWNVLGPANPDCLCQDPRVRAVP